MYNNFRSDLAKAKGEGSAKTGATHWLYQRITAIILVMCSVWLVFFLKYIGSRGSTEFIASIQKPYNLVPFGILVVASFYHAMLGMRVIIEDYISCIKLRTTLIILLQLFCITTIATFIVALFYTISI